MSNFKESLKEVEAELATIEPRYQLLIDAARALRNLVKSEGKGVGDTNGKVEAVPDPLAGIEIPPNSFLNMSARQATLMCLHLAKRPLTTRQLVDLIEGSGFTHGSKNFVNSLNTTLDRQYKKYQEINKTADGWEINDKGRASLNAVMSGAAVLFG